MIANVAVNSTVASPAVAAGLVTFPAALTTASLEDVHVIALPSVVSAGSVISLVTFEVSDKLTALSTNFLIAAVYFLLLYFFIRLSYSSDVIGMIVPWLAAGSGME